MQKRIYKNVQIRNVVAGNELHKIFLKSLLYNRNLTNQIEETKRYSTWDMLYSLKRNSSKSKIQNLCLSSKKSNSTYRIFKLNRSKIKHFAAKGLLSGIRRASW